MNRDLSRQLWVSACEVLCIFGTLLGTGLIGNRVEESSGGTFAADATLLAPGRQAFSIWSLLYLGLFAYTIWQWLPRNKTSARARATGWLAGVSMLLNAGWLLVTQVGLVWVSVGVIAALALTLGVLLRRLGALPAPSSTDLLIVDGTFGGYLGWVSVATCANVAAAGMASGWTLGPVVDQVLAVVVLAVAAALGVLLAHRFGGRLAVAAALSWGLVWIAVGRLTDAPASTLVGVGALAAAAVVVAGTLVTRSRAALPASAHA